MAEALEVKVPDIGDFSDVPVIEVLVKAGDRVERDAALITLESDKAAMEVPSPQAGIVKDVRIKEGDKVSQGTVILMLEVAAESAEVRSEAKPAPASDKRPPGKQQAAKPAPAVVESEAKTASAASTIEVKVPDIGDFSDVPVIEVLVKAGDRVERDAALITLESDKAAMEVPSPQAGIVKDVRIKEGDKVSQGAVVCLLQIETAAATPAGAAAPAEQEPASAETVALETFGEPPPPAERVGAVPYASPAVRKFARELGVDLSRVRGGGPRGRILREDVQSFVKKNLATPTTAAVGSGLPSMPVVDFSQWGEVEIKPLPRIRRLSAANLHRNWLLVPHVTQTDSADITELEALRKAQNASGNGVKLTLLPFLMKACAVAIRAYPEFGASLDAGGENLVLKRYCHIGFAADTDNGLVVPVVRDVDKKSVTQLAVECAELAVRARDGKLKAEEMKGGCFSISSLGGIGGSHFTPIVNAPEVAILGVSRAAMQPVWDGKQFTPRLMLPLSLSYDHRVIDGAYAARFITHLVGLLSDLRRLIL